MIQVEHLTYARPGKYLFNDASFTLEDGRHCALIGSNGTGKSTLIDMLLHSDDYVYSGRIRKKGINRTGYVSQFARHEKDRDVTVFAYLCEDFETMQARMDELCTKMESEPDSEAVMQEYQACLDEFMAIDGYSYEQNIRRQLRTAGLEHIADVGLADVSGGEYKLIQIIRQMLLLPDLLVMDEPDVFLDFENLSGLRRLINTYPGTLLTATHCRYLLNRCFDCILQIEDRAVTLYDGPYTEFGLAQLQLKIELQEASQKEADYIAEQEILVERLRDEATKTDSLTKGKTLHARVSYLERWKARHIREPYLGDLSPNVRLPEVTPADPAPDYIARADEYGITFENTLLEHVSFTVLPGEKVALVGPNGSGKTTLLRQLWNGSSPALSVADGVTMDFLSQFHGEILPEELTVWQLMEQLGYEVRADAQRYLDGYFFEEGILDRPIRTLSGGEKNLLLLAKIGAGHGDLLLLDEPTSHLDLRTQLALEDALRGYKGTVLMVSHDFYTVANCADYVLYFEDGTVRRMSGRAFRKLIYRRHYPQDYLALEQDKKALELQVTAALQENNYETARTLCVKLDEIITRLNALKD